jgi:hypothetical protein
MLLAHIREIQMSNLGKTIAVIRAVITRWTAHYLAFDRLLSLRPTLIALINLDAGRQEKDKVVISGDKAAKIRSRKMIEIIEDPLFWHSLLR